MCWATPTTTEPAPASAPLVAWVTPAPLAAAGRPAIGAPEIGAKEATLPAGNYYKTIASAPARAAGNAAATAAAA
jgi:hypothetical protein